MHSGANTQSNSFRNMTLLVFVFYALILFKLILFKRSPGYYKNHFLHHYSWQLVKSNFKSANYTPFATIILFAKSRLQMGDIMANLVGNIVGFIPLGILLPVLFRNYNSAKKVIATVFVVSLSFEIVQLFTVLGNFDVDDLMLNTLGGSLGYLIFRAERNYAARRQQV